MPSVRPSSYSSSSSSPLSSPSRLMTLALLLTGYYSQFYHSPPYYAGTLSVVAAITILSTVAKLVLSPVEGLLFDGATLSALASPSLSNSSPAPLADPILTPRPALAVLLLSALTVYTSNVLAALRFLPLDALPPSSFFPSVDPVTTLARVKSVAGGNLGPVRLVEALQSVAASHMIIAVRRPLALCLSLSLLVQHPLTHSLSPSSTQVSLTGVLAIQGAQGWAERPSSTGRPVPAVAPAAEAPKEAAR